MKNDAMNDLANGTPPGFGYQSKINRFAKYVARIWPTSIEYVESVTLQVSCLTHRERAFSSAS